MPQLISQEQARAAAGQTDLTGEQIDAAVGMLTATTATTVLIAPAGAGKSHTMAGFARLWTTHTGRRVVGLTTSTNAARVLQNEGLAESYNIAEFLGKTEGSDELRRPIPLHRDDVLVLDEASQLATADLAMVQEAARRAGARLVLVGDTEQLGAVEAGGMFRLLAREVPAAELHEIRRFDAAWEGGASVRLRAGDFAAYATYDRHGRMRGADQETAMDRAAGLWLADYLRGKSVLLLAGSNSEAAELSRRVQAKLIQLGTVGPPHVALADGNQAGTGDLIRARLNTTINAGGRELTNRDTLRITGWRGPGALVQRRELDGTWTSPFLVPMTYLAHNAELDYAGNTHVGQGRTVDTAHLLVTESLSRRSLYVGLTRGRESNTTHIVTGQTAPPGHPPYEQASAESVVKAILERDEADLSATEQIRQAQDWTGGTDHLLQLWSAAVKDSLYPQIDTQVKARLTESQALRYQREHSRPALRQRLRAAQLAGHDIGAIIDQITVAPLDGARSISGVLHGRLQQLQLPDPGHEVTWAQRTPRNAAQVADELAVGLDERRRELGERLAANPEPWLARHLGVLSPDASPALREDYVRRAGTAAAYREARGITDPRQAVSFAPHPEPELAAMQRDTFASLEITDEQAEIGAMSHGELQARVLEGERAQATAPPEVSGRLRLTAQAEADAWQQSAAAEADHNPVKAASARALAHQMAAEKTRLEAASAKYEEWSAKTAGTRETAGKAKAELHRRGHEPAPAGTPQPQSTLNWRRQVEANLEAADQVLTHQQQAAVDTGEPWPPPARHSQAQPEAERAPQPGNPVAEQPEILEPGPGRDAQRAVRLDELHARAGNAAARIEARQAELEASSQYTARMQREAQAEPQADRQAKAKAPDEIEMELQ